MHPTQDRVFDLLRYDPETGLFTWACVRGGRRPGDPAGRVDGRGYLQISVDGRRYRAHRLARLSIHGIWPADDIDHIDGDRLNNRLTNLRTCTRAENMQNVASSRRRGTGLPGTTYNHRTQKWQAQISSGGRKHHLGYFVDVKDAHEAYLRAKAALHTFCPTLRAA
ncbi:HNH endonuclease [Methylococcus sp. ANG]|uniref:HNH endonuclease n=1 Tax=Methylococcus sp. ANG TaxID=3231903 RepID=UPI003459F7E3